MKKIITLFALSLAFVCSHAQISITNADMPMVDDTFRLSTAFDAQGLDPALTGANYSWDFSTLVPSAQRIDTFFSVASTPFAYQLFFNNPFSPQYYSSYATRGLEFSVPQVVSFTEVMNYIKNKGSR